MNEENFLPRSPFSLFLGILAFLPLATLGAQAKPVSEERVVLVKGTETAKGLPFFEPNALSCMRGSYSFRDGYIDIWFTKEALFLDSSWSAGRLGGNSVRRKVFSGKEVTAYHGSEKWTVFLCPDHEEKNLAAFFAVFLERFRYFLQYAKDDSEVSFPAILKVPR